MKEKLWRTEDLKYYVVTMELHGLLLFSSQSHPYPTGYVQTQLPVIHNYPLLLALKGQVCEESYIVGYNKLKKTENPARRFGESRVYAYPAIVEKAYYKRVLMSMSETDYIVYKPMTRACVPIMVHHNMLAPGTLAKTVVVSEDEMPRELYIRVGVKRFGTWKATFNEAEAEVVSNVTDINFPFNTLDVKNVLNYTLILRHYAGDIAIFGKASEALKLKSRLGTLFLPIPLFISA